MPMRLKILCAAPALLLTVALGAMSRHMPAPGLQPVPTDDYERYLLTADSAARLMKAERWSDAEAALKRALRLRPADPSNGLLFSNLGYCQTMQGDYATALQSYDIALIKTKDSPAIYENRARTYLLQGDEQHARQDLDRAIDLDSTRRNALTLRSTLLLKQGDSEKALTDLKLLDKVHPGDAWTLTAMGECLVRKGDKSEADSCFREALLHNPDPESYTAIAGHYIDSDRLQDADETIYQALTRYPREGMLYLLRGVLHRMRFQNTEAEIDKKIAMEYGVDSQTVEDYLPTIAPKKR